MIEVNQAQQKHGNGTAKTIRGYIGWLLTIFCVAVLAWKIDWVGVLNAFHHANIILIIVGLIPVFACYLVFAARWRYILGNIYPYRPVFLMMMIGYMANSLLPLRAGDPLRSVLASEHLGLKLATVVGSILLERLGDIFSLCFIALLVMWSVDLPMIIVVSLQVVAALMVIVLGGVIWIAANRDRFTRILNQIFGGGSHLASIVISQFEHMADAFSALGRDYCSMCYQLIGIAAISLIAWGVYSLGMIACISAFGISNPILPALLLVVVTNLGYIVPSSPGSIGIYHALALVALSIWNIELETAMAIGIVTHLITVIMQVVLGLVGLRQINRAQ
jgi:uncharacterized protein (TIRG00374 family)